MRPRLAVLGGSSPFTVALIDALAAHPLPGCDLLLHGRDALNLERVRRYGAHTLSDWRVQSSPDLACVLDGADIVIHQIRYGDMAGRDQDEQLALQFGAPPDETLGPGALHAILRTAPALRRMSAELARRSPQARVLNLTNPLSLATAIMADAGVANCVGICELPLVTARGAAAVLEMPFEAFEWSYIGLNHRGFVVQLTDSGTDRLADLPEALGAGDIGGVRAETIRQLQALPTKYFKLVTGEESPRGGRAAFLSALRRQIAAELDHDPTTSPPSLRQRNVDWYPLATVPMVAALLSTTSTRQIVNVSQAEGWVEERHAWVSATAIDLEPRPAASAEVTQWLRQYEAHEQALLQAVRCPRRDHIAQALDLDPTVPASSVASMADAIWERYSQPTALHESGS